MEEMLQEQMVEEQVEVPVERDYGREVQELYESRPELRGSELPDAVLQACVGGMSLQEAYHDYARRRRQETADLRRENRILRQNVKTAAKAPVRGVSRGGSVAAQPEDAFLRGFNSEW